MRLAKISFNVICFATLFLPMADADSDEFSSDLSDLSNDEIDDEIEDERPSETRMIREMGENARGLQSSRPAPTRHDPQPKPAAQIKKVNTLFNFKFSKSIPVADAVSSKKQKRADKATVEPEEIQVSASPWSSFFFLAPKIL